MSTVRKGLRLWLEGRFLLPFPLALRRALTWSYGSPAYTVAWGPKTRSATHWMAHAFLVPDSKVVFYGKRTYWSPRRPIPHGVLMRGDFTDDGSIFCSWDTGRARYTDLAVSRKDFEMRVREIRSWTRESSTVPFRAHPKQGESA